MIDIGKTLADGRFKKGLSREELAQIIGTFPSFIAAIETNQFSDLPEKETVRVIEEYAKTVGENEKPLLMFYANWLKENPTLSRRRGFAKKGFFQKKYIGTFLLTVLALLIVVVVLNLTLKERNKGTFNQAQTPPAKVTTKEPAKTKVTETKKPEKEEAKEKEDTKKDKTVKEETTKEEPKKESTEKKEPQLAIKVDKTKITQRAVVPMTIQGAGKAFDISLKTTNGACWFQVIQDGKSIYQKSLQAKKEAVIPIDKDAKNIRLLLGAASYAVIQVDNQNFPDLKAVGPEPVTFDITLKK